jgi:hypothetical protein
MRRDDAMQHDLTIRPEIESETERLLRLAREQIEMLKHDKRVLTEALRGSVVVADRLIARVTRRAPDFLIGGADDPYIRRWWVIPRNRWFNVYLHQFLRSDDDRALHDHPWANCSILLRGATRAHGRRAGGRRVLELLYRARHPLPPSGASRTASSCCPTTSATDRDRPVLDAVHHRPALPRVGLPLPLHRTTHRGRTA